MLKMMSESQVLPRLQTGGCWQLPAKVEQLPPRKEASPFLPHPRGGTPAPAQVRLCVLWLPARSLGQFSVKEALGEIQITVSCSKTARLGN